MSTSVSRIDSGGVSLDAPRPQAVQTAVGFVQLLDEHWRLAKMLVSSGMLPKSVSKPEAAMAILLKAYELQIPAMYAFANLHYFDGRLVESAALMVGMAAERCGVTYEVVEWTDERCELLFSRSGWSKPLPSVFTMEDAKRAQLAGKDNWKKYPKAMLLARTQAQGVRAIAPDRFGGMYSAEEVRDFGATPLSSGSGERTAAVTAALHADDPDEIQEGEATVVESEPGPMDERTQRAQGRYFALLAERGIEDETDRRVFQERLHREGLVSSASCRNWTRQDFLSAAAEVEKTAPVEEVGS